MHNLVAVPPMSGFKKWGFKQIRGKRLRFLDFPSLLGPPENDEKGGKRAKKADFSRFPGQEARHPLNPH